MIPSFCLFAFLLFSRWGAVAGIAPTIDLSHNMRILKLPQDTPVGSVIYRLRGSDPDNDVLTFGVRGDIGNQLLDIRAVTETRANVILKSKPTEKEYKLTIYVTDGTQTTEVESSILITNSTNPKSAFLQYDPLISVSELTSEGEVIGTVVVRKRNSSSLPVLFGVEGGADKFVVRYVISPLKEASKAEISLLQRLDYEKQNLFRLAIYALNPWTDEQYDTRNVAVVDILVAVKDAQDTPPVFHPMAPVVRISDNLALGANVTQIVAEDGDYGNQRNITYSFVAGSTGSTYFNIHSRTGMITLATSTERLRETYSTSGPFVLTIQATEVETEVFPGSPQGAESTIAVVLVNTENRPPRFFSRRYVASVEENSPVLTALTWEGAAMPRVMDDDQGKNGSFELFLEGDNGAFSVQPARGMNELNFALLVKDPSTLDYETSDTKYIEFKIVARETASVRPLSAVAEVRVKLTDANDNIPQFTHEVYNVTLPEDAGPRTLLVKIQATDEDTGSYGTVRYTAVNGPIAGILRLDPVSGELTLVSGEGLDRERVPEYTLTVEARDDQGRGNRNAAEVRVALADANDNAPLFLQPRYDAVLNPDMKNFYEPLRVQAYDADGPGPNSNITYEIVNGNYQEKFLIDPQSGEIRLRSPLLTEQDSRDHGLPVITLTVRAHDQGVPVQFATVKVQVHNQEYLNRSISFVVPLSARRASERKQELERGFSTLTGAHVNVHSVAFHNTSQEKSVVRCWVSYPLSSTVDLSNMDVIIGNIIGREYYLATSKVEAINRSNFDVVFWLLIALVILMLLAILALFFYCCCVRATDGRDILDMKNKIVPEENIIHYKEEGATILNNDSRRRSDSRTRENWQENRRSQQVALKKRPSQDEGEASSPRHQRPQQATVHIGEPITTTYAQTIEEEAPTRGGYLPNGIPVVAGGRMERAYRGGRPLSPGAEMLVQEIGGDVPDARRLGNYVVVRKVVRPRVRVDAADNQGDDGEEGPRRTEILYIRSPMREDEEERHYIREGELLRSVSETALHTADDPHLRVPRTYRVRPQPLHHRPHQEPLEPGNQQLKFSRYHRVEGEEPVLVSEQPPAAWVPAGYEQPHPGYLQHRQPQYERWDTDYNAQRHASMRLQQQAADEFRSRMMDTNTYPGPQRMQQQQYYRDPQQQPPYEPQQMLQQQRHQQQLILQQMRPPEQQMRPPEQQLPSQQWERHPEHEEATDQRNDVDDDSKTVIMAHGHRTEPRYSIPRLPLEDVATQLKYQQQAQFDEQHDDEATQHQEEQEAEAEADEAEPEQPSPVAASIGAAVLAVLTKQDEELEPQDSNQPETDVVDSRETQEESDRLYTEDSRTTARNKQTTEDEVSRTDHHGGSDGEEDSDSGIGKDGASLRLKKANLMEKKSLFTIAYDGMQTRGLKSAGERDDSP